MTMYSIFNISNKFKSKAFLGFTLVELIISLAITSVIGTIIVSILFTTLRVSKKTDMLISLKNSGNTALSKVAKQIRYAKTLNSPSSCLATTTTSSVSVTSISDNKLVTIACTEGVDQTVVLNGQSLIDTFSASVSNCIFICSQSSLNDPPVIKFSFLLTSKNPTGLGEESASVPFQTTVTLRNYNQ